MTEFEHEWAAPATPLEDRDRWLLALDEAQLRAVADALSYYQVAGYGQGGQGETLNKVEDWIEVITRQEEVDHVDAIDRTVTQINMMIRSVDAHD